MNPGDHLRNRLTGDRADVIETETTGGDHVMRAELEYVTGPQRGQTFEASAEWLASVFDPTGLPA